MNSFTKSILKLLMVAGIVLATGYGIYKLYNFVIEDATHRIRKGVGKGIKDVVNPLKWF